MKLWVLYNCKTLRPVYADPDTIRRNGDLVKIWILYNFKTLRTEYADPDTHYRQWWRDLFYLALAKNNSAVLKNAIRGS